MSGTCEQLYCLTVGWEYVPRSLILSPDEDESPMHLPLTALLARSDDRWLLFDTGLGPECRDHDFASQWYQWGDPELPGEGDEDPLVHELGRVGVSIDEIDALVISHLHVDHTGGIRHFADGRPVYIQRAELEHALSDEANPALHYKPHYDDPAINWQQLDGDAEIAPGIRALSTPGHAPGHMSFLIDLPDSGRWLFAYDAIPTIKNVEMNRHIAICSVPGQEEMIPRAQQRVLDVAKSEGARMQPGHCPETWPGRTEPARLT